jgi:hypothetical protein
MRSVVRSTVDRSDRNSHIFLYDPRVQIHPLFAPYSSAAAIPTADATGLYCGLDVIVAESLSMKCRKGTNRFRVSFSEWTETK